MEKRRQSSAARLTEDLIIEILIYLPLISILRFRCVCKSWYNLLDHKFLNTNHKNIKLLVGKYNPVNRKEYNVELKSLISSENGLNVMYPFKKSYRSNQIVGSCNGLVCVRIYDDNVFYVWNPCTAEYKVISKVTVPDRYFNGITHINYGFGYDSKTCDYKLVTIYTSKIEMDGHSQAEMHTLGSEKYRYCCSVPFKIPNCEPGVLLNGALHWLARSYISDPRLLILSFDMEEERPKDIPLPFEYMNDFDDKFDKFVDVLRGCLCLLCSVSNVEFEIWEMKDYGVRESWSKLFKADMQQFMTMGIRSFRSLRRVVYLPDGHILLEVSDKPWEVDVVKINLEEKKGYEYMKNICQMVPHMESLVSVNSRTFVGDEQVGDVRG